MIGYSVGALIGKLIRLTVSIHSCYYFLSGSAFFTAPVLLPPLLSSPANLTSRFTHARIRAHTRTHSIISPRPRPRSREIRKRLYRARGYHNWERFVCTSFILRFLPFDSKEGEESDEICVELRVIMPLFPTRIRSNSIHILGNHSTLFSFVTLFTKF